MILVTCGCILQNVSGCAAMDGCLACLAQEYLNVKFCRIKASEARLSFRFVSCCFLFYTPNTLNRFEKICCL